MNLQGAHGVYIGDGLYLSFDGYNVWVETEREGQMHSIALEPGMVERIASYRAEITARLTGGA